MRDLSKADHPERVLFGPTEFQKDAIRVHLNVGKLGAKQGDSFELRSAKEYSQDRFISDFNAHRSEGMQNATLGFKEERFGWKSTGNTLRSETMN